MKNKKYLLAFLLLQVMIACNNPKTNDDTNSNLPAANKVDTLYVTDTLRIAANDTIAGNKSDTILEVTSNAFIHAGKMNVLYVGVENPIHVELTGVAFKDIQASVTDGNIRTSGNNYTVSVSEPGGISIDLTGKGLTEKKYDFRVKRIPDPVARLSASSGGEMGTGEFKAQGGVGAFLDNFDFDAKCVIGGFELTYIARRQDPISVINAGARYNAKARRLVNNAKPGDVYIFTNVKSKCPGDKTSRSVNSMAFIIK